MDTWKDFNCARRWSGVPKEVVKAIHTELGDEKLDRLNAIAALSPSEVAKAMTVAQPA